MCRARREGLRTLSATADANLGCAFVENALFYTILDCEKSTQNIIELVTIPARGLGGRETSSDVPPG